MKVSVSRSFYRNWMTSYSRPFFILLLLLHPSFYAEEGGSLSLKSEFDNTEGVTASFRYQKRNGIDIDFRYLENYLAAERLYAFSFETPFSQVGELEYSGLLRVMRSEKLLSPGILYESTKTTLLRSKYTPFNQFSSHFGVSLSNFGKNQIGGFFRFDEVEPEYGGWGSLNYDSLSLTFAVLNRALPKKSDKEWYYEEEEDLAGIKISLLAFDLRYRFEKNILGMQNEVFVPFVGKMGWRITPFFIREGKDYQISARYSLRSEEFYTADGEFVSEEWAYDVSGQYTWLRDGLYEARWLHSQESQKRRDTYSWMQKIGYFSDLWGGSFRLEGGRSGEEESVHSLSHAYLLRWGKEQYVSASLKFQDLEWGEFTLKGQFYLFTPAIRWRSQVSLRPLNPLESLAREIQLKTLVKVSLLSQLFYDSPEGNLSLAVGYGYPYDYPEGERELWGYHGVTIKFSVSKSLAWD